MGKVTGLATLCVALVAISACGGSSGSSAATDRGATTEVSQPTQATTAADAATTTAPPTPASPTTAPLDEPAVVGDLVQLTIDQLPAQDGNEWKSNIEIPNVLTLQGACAANVATPAHSYESWASGSVNLTYQHVAFSSPADASEAFDKLADGTAPCEYDIGEGAAKQTWSLSNSAPIADRSGAKIAQFRHSVGGVEVDTVVIARNNTVADLIFFGGPPSDSLSAAIFAAILGSGGGPSPDSTTLPPVSTSATGTRATQIEEVTADLVNGSGLFAAPMTDVPLTVAKLENDAPCQPPGSFYPLLVNHSFTSAEPASVEEASFKRIRFDTHDAGIQAMVIIGSQTVGCTDQKIGAGTLVRLDPVAVGELAYRYTITGKSAAGGPGATWDVCVSLNGLEQDQALIQIPDSRYDVAKADQYFAALGCVPKNG